MNTGDLVFCNLQTVGCAWHIVTTGAANAALHLDDASSDQIWADAIQLEAAPVASSLIAVLMPRG